MMSAVTIGQTTVFINEIHYDNTTGGGPGDVNEGFEIAGPAGTDLAGWTVAKYNGSNGTVYGTESLSGIIPDQDNGYGTLWFGLPQNGMQNGSPDGLALVAADGTTVIQFLSYEGVLTAVGGPADGTISTDIGVSEPGTTAIDDALQLIGSGTEYENFSWSGPFVNTRGMVNTGQSFGAAVPTVSITSPADFAVLPGGTTSVDVVFTTTNTMPGDTVDITVTLNGGTPTTTNDVTSPFTISPTAGGEAYEVTAELIRASSVIDFETIDFTIAYPCDLVVDPVFTTCDAETGGIDTYTVELDFTNGGTSNYTIFTVPNYTIDYTNGDPSTDASGYITISGIDEGQDVSVSFIGDSGNSSCDFTVDVVSPTCVPTTCANPGDIVITEIMRNPSAVSDANGEYFEVFNTTGSAIDMQGWIIKDDASPTETHTIASSVSVPAGGYAVFVINDDPLVNGGITASYGYSIISLSNSGTSADGIVLECSGTIIDQVIWDGTFPSAASGVSMELTTAAASRNNVDNDDGANWALAVSAYGDGDLGTPGIVNDNSNPLSTNEFGGTDFDMYPNPTSTGFVTVKTATNDIVAVAVYDILGKEVMIQEVNNERLDVSQLKAGVYIIRLTQNEKTVTKKLIIK